MRYAPLASILAIALLLTCVPAVIQAQDALPQIPAAALEGENLPIARQLRNVAIRLPAAALLGAALAFRPRRRGTPQRSAPVVQTQIVLAIVGAVVMLVVGSSVARAFGVVGVAGLIRYRAKIEDPKDASVMLATLALGLAAGVGLYVIASFSTVFILAVLWLVESFEPQPYKLFELKISSKGTETLRPRVERLLRRSQITFELRGSSPEEVTYEVRLPQEAKTDSLTDAIVDLDEASAVEWDEKKKKDKG